MKNTKLAVAIFIIILIGCIGTNKFTKHSIDKLETYIVSIYYSNASDNTSIDKMQNLKDNFAKLKPVLEGMIDKEYLHQLNTEINILEHYIKEKDTISARQSCVEIMSLLDNIECYYISVI